MTRRLQTRHFDDAAARAFRLRYTGREQKHKAGRNSVTRHFCSPKNPQGRRQGCFVQVQRQHAQFLSLGKVPEAVLLRSFRNSILLRMAPAYQILSSGGDDRAHHFDPPDPERKHAVPGGSRGENHRAGRAR
jgi:hypothetical protein